MRFPAGFRSCSAVLLLSLASLAAADIHYTVELSSDQSRMVVTVEIPPKKGAKDLTLQMPRWAPGGYDYNDAGKQITDAVARDERGAALPLEHPDFSTWRLPTAPAGKVFVSYSIKSPVQNDVLHYSGPSTYMYVVDRMKETCLLTLRVPEDWPVATGLMPAPGIHNEFQAPNYDVFADNPVTAGKFTGDSYVAGTRLHYVAMRGKPEDIQAVDRERLHKTLEFISAMETNFWGDAPFHHYVWHMTVFPAPDGGWGLEHLASTQIGLSTGVGPGMQGVLAHEYFHLWNVKRIRSKPLGPFNYQELPQTGALWWLEGVTDYYAHMLLRRYGWTDDKRFFGVVASTLGKVRRNEKRLTVSPYEASYRVRDANGGRGNSSGYEISYYDLGFLVGFCLDMAIRNETHNKRSLDDVAKALYKKYGNGQPGFEEDGIRKECIRVGGPALGPIYDKLVMQPGELPVEDALAKIGMQLAEVDETYTKLGFRPVASRERGGYEVRDPDAGLGLKEGDLLVGINDKNLADMPFTNLRGVIATDLTNAPAGTVIHLTVKREGTAGTVSVDVTPTSATRKQTVIQEIPGASEAAVKLRQAWLTPPSDWFMPAASG